MSEQRDIRGEHRLGREPARRGRNLIAVIGIDRYQHWRPLSNAVSDARGARELFERLGFTSVTEPLMDGAATQRAIQSLVTDDLATLQPEDSLVLFYAGHGGNRRHVVGDREVATGYLIPVDADERRVSTWVDLEAWLRAAALLPARHILVILDACHSGIALDPVIKWRDDASPRTEPLWTLNARRSRRIITSALEDQRAMDSGPKPGHSLFTGCLIEALTHDLHRSAGAFTTGSELGLHLQRRVASYPHSQQTPDCGAFAFDARGEMLISLVPDLELERRIEATPTWLKRIDLDDRPVPTRSAGARPAAVHGTEVGAEGHLAIAAAPAAMAPSASDIGVARSEDLIAPIDRDAPYAALEVEHGADTTGLGPHTEPPQATAPSPVDATVPTRAETPPAAAPAPDAVEIASRPVVPCTESVAVEIASRPAVPWIGPHAGMHPVVLVVLIAAILAVLVAGMTVAWNMLGRSTTSANTDVAPTALQSGPTIATAQQTAPPTAKIALEQPDPEDVKVTRPGVIESILDRDTAVEEAQIIARLKGNKLLEVQARAMNNELAHQRELLDAATRRWGTAHAAGDQAAEEAAQIEISERRKLIATRERAYNANRADLETYLIRAPGNGTFVPSAKVNAPVAADTAIGKLVRAPVPVATFRVSNTSSFAGNGSVEISIHKGEQRVTCTVADVQPDSVKVSCPPDPELREGLEVALHPPAAASAPRPEPPPSGGAGSAR